MKRLTDCSYVPNRNTRELMKEHEFSRFLVTGGKEKEDSCGTLQEKGATDVLQKQATF